MNEHRDVNGNLLKVGDKVKFIYEDYSGAYTYNKIYTILSFGNYYINTLDNNNCSNGFHYSRFVKVDCLKNKIRKLRKLIKK